MQIRPTPLEGCFIIQPKIFEDERGYFYESFNKQQFENLTGQRINFVQDNESLSSKGVLRGLHFQKGEFAQAKLVRVVKGAVQDVVVDVRPGSKTYGQFFSIELSEENKTQLFIPRGLAHGFLALEDTTVFSYKCDNFYNKEAELGIIFNDKDLKITWNSLDNDFIVSEKDLKLPKFRTIDL
ncbi:dTDP-4-dehydrorhamnose 3,5-epimerase [Winogradskyella sp.]|uniref:dTDP-4-dehydrorhamnose 3,5-epimerase n=1 Tax=Winogradskyella sp. TaxID=1883156 RepID=UPI0035C85318